VARGEIHRASGHYPGELLVVDPHCVCSFSKRLMRRHRHDARERATKTAQTGNVSSGPARGITTGLVEFRIFRDGEVFVGSEKIHQKN
jgi:hypothetical protein